jgi:hypothetical protein
MNSHSSSSIQVNFMQTRRPHGGRAGEREGLDHELNLVLKCVRNAQPRNISEGESPLSDSTAIEPSERDVRPFYRYCS